MNVVARNAIKTVFLDDWKDGRGCQAYRVKAAWVSRVRTAGGQIRLRFARRRLERFAAARLAFPS